MAAREVRNACIIIVAGKIAVGPCKMLECSTQGLAYIAVMHLPSTHRASTHCTTVVCLCMPVCHMFTSAVQLGTIQRSQTRPVRTYTNTGWQQWQSDRVFVRLGSFI